MGTFPSRSCLRWACLSMWAALLGHRRYFFQKFSAGVAVPAGLPLRRGRCGMAGRPCVFSLV